LPVKAQCLPFNQIPHTNQLFADFLTYSPKVRRFFQRPPHIGKWIAEEAAHIQYSDILRKSVSSILERQNRAWGTSDKTIANIQRLRSGAFAAVTGQQVGLFGGPLFSLFKALTAVKCAEESTRAGVDCVPIFWLATQDHDLAEVQQAHLPGNEGVLETITAPSAALENVPVGTVEFGSEITQLVESATQLLGESDLSEILPECYRAGETYGSAFARLFSRVFADWGVILLDANDPELNRAAEPMYRAAVEAAAELDQKLLARGKELEASGYDQQVRITEASTLLFALQDGERIAVQRRENAFSSTLDFVIGEKKISQADLLRQITSAPEQFSPNVLLRPVVQDYLLPTLVYAGGGAEIAYFAQAAVVYESLLRRVTPIVPRFSATLVEPRLQSLLERYQLSLPDIFRGPERLREQLAEHALPKEMHFAFESAEASLETSMSALRDVLLNLDKTLVDAANTAREKIHYQIDQLRARAARAELRQAEVLGRHAQLLSNALFPNKILQEREISGIYFLARYGTGLLRDLYECIHPECVDHQVIAI
jgi:bacillithiol synthase